MPPETPSFASEATLEALELPALLRLVACEAACDAGRERVEALRPQADPVVVAAVLRRAREAAALLEDGALVASIGEPLLPVLELLRHDRGALNAAELAPLRFLLRASAAAASRIRRAEPPAPALADLLDSLPELDELAAQIERTVDDRGRVREDASPALAAATKKSRRLRQSLYAKLERYVSRHGDHLAEETVPLHGGRLVVLLRSGAKGRLAGLVHGSSATGKSFYFEPMEAVEENNALQEALAIQEQERQRVLNELIEALHGARDELDLHAEFVAELDLRQAAHRFGQRCEANLIEPRDGGELALLDARHPLLDPALAAVRERALGQAGHTGEVVPLTIRLGSEERVLVVTGPNAGGKTVTLKTVGLLAAAAHCGLPIPAAAGSSLPLLCQVVATVGDEQDLLADRSTFSGRLMRLREAWDAAAPGRLVLVDELGSGTDPEEGAALAVALMEELVDRGALSILTSHLTPLAAAALERDGAGCAAMEFDGETGRPTFELVPGPPGSSEAIALARRLGLPEEWLGRAEALLGPGHRKLQDLLHEVEASRQELAEERRSARRLRLEVETERRSLEEAQEALEGERAELAAESRSRIGSFRDQVTKELRAEYARLKESLEAGRKRGLVADAVGRLFEEAPLPPPAAPPGDIEVGSRVRHSGLGWEGEVSKAEGGRIEVVVRGKRIRCKPGELELIEEGAGKSKSEKPVPPSAPSIEEVTPELHLRGRSVEDALAELDGYLDRALLSSRPEVRVVHGHGTGRLKQAVREHLRRHPAVASWRAGGRGEGGDGATVVRLDA